VNGYISFEGKANLLEKAEGNNEIGAFRITGQTGGLLLVRLPGLRMIMPPVPCQGILLSAKIHALMQATFPKPSIREAAVSHRNVMLPYRGGRIYISAPSNFLQTGYALSNTIGATTTQANGIPKRLGRGVPPPLPRLRHAALCWIGDQDGWGDRAPCPQLARIADEWAIRISSVEEAS